MNQTLKLAIIIFLITTFPAFSQTGLWLGGNQEIGLGNDYNLKLRQDQRYEAMVQEYDQSLFQIGIKKNLPNNWNIEIPLRYTNFGNHTMHKNAMRFGLMGSKSLPLNKKQMLGFRSSYQIDQLWGLQNDLLFNWRNKLDFRQNWNQILQTKIENELWLRTQSALQFERIRLSLNNQIELNKKNAIVLGYFVQHKIPFQFGPWEKILFIRYKRKFSGEESVLNLFRSKLPHSQSS
ncbi:Protein of unknown function [Spirosomataceae bacterium TFI 002]|nr:Protein of unknown function [Spirosomataceae bacterium TFI 002]